MAFGIDDAFGGIAGAGASIFGNLVSGQQAQQNAQNQFFYNLALQQQSQMYNTEMANTQYQRTTADMKKAGLNPILAAGGFSPDSASGGAGSVGQAPVVNPTAGAVASAEQGAKLSKAIEALSKSISNMEETNKKIQADTALTQQQTRTERMRTPLTAGALVKQDIDTQHTAADIPRVQAEAQRSKQSAYREKLVGPGNVDNAQTYVPLVKGVVDAVSPPEKIVPNSAKTQVFGTGNAHPSDFRSEITDAEARAKLRKNWHTKE